MPPVSCAGTSVAPLLLRNCILSADFYSSYPYWDILILYTPQKVENQGSGEASFKLVYSSQVKEGDGASGLCSVCIDTHLPTLVPLPWALPPMDIHSQQLAPWELHCV